MTILQSITWELVQQALAFIAHSFAKEGLTLWCLKPPTRVIDPDHPSRLLHLSCYVNGIMGQAHPAVK